MTNTIDPQRGEKSPKSAPARAIVRYLANLTDKVWSIEIIKPLFDVPELGASLIAAGYDEYKSITTKNADGYWHRSTRSRHLRNRPCAAAAPAQLKGDGVMSRSAARRAARLKVTKRSRQAAPSRSRAPTSMAGRSSISSPSPSWWAM
jgi:hypothetical protein